MKKARHSKFLLGVLLIAVFAVCIGGAMACSKEFTVKFDSDGGTSVESITVKNNSTIDAPTPPTKTGFNFDKWVKPDNIEFGFGTEKITQNLTLKAIWNTITYKVTFQGATIAEQVINYNGIATRPETDPTKAGEIFVDWYEDQTFTIKFDFSKPILRDTVIYARFTREIERIFNVTFMGSDTPIADRQTNKGGMITDLPTAVKEGSVFAGWWISDFYDENKLTARYVDQILEENMVFYAVWEGNGTTVSVNSEGVTWASKGVNLNYRLSITPPAGSAEIFNVSALRYDYDFASKAEGEYKIEVMVNSITTTVYLHNKALSRVSLLEHEDDLFKFNTVSNADKYLITINCGNKTSVHVNTHTDHDNGKLTTFDFKNCDMQVGGIKFVVKAVATGFITSTSVEYIVERNLAAVTNIRVNDATQRFEWDEVTNAQTYIVKINDGTPKPTQELVSDSVKYYDPGDIKITIQADARGYNSSVAEYTYSKVRIASPHPRDIRLEDGILKWVAVTGASNGYVVKINDFEKTAATNQLPLPQEAGVNFNISIKALGATAAQDSIFGDEEFFSDSLIDKVFYSNGKVYWANIVNAVKYGIKINDGDITEITGSMEYYPDFKQTGIHVIEVCAYDKDGNESDWGEKRVEIFSVTLRYNMEGYENFSVLFRAKNDDLNLPDGALTGYTFRFWSATQGTSGQEFTGLTLLSAENLTLYARWDFATYTVTLVSTGGSLDVETDTVEYLQTFKLPIPTPNDVSQVFAGWYLGSGGHGEITDGEGYSIKNWEITENTTLYAHYVTALMFELEIDGKGYIVSKAPGISYSPTITIPVFYGTGDARLLVTTVKANGFQSTPTLVTVNIPDTIKLIQTGSSGGNAIGSAFYNCNNIKAVNIYKVDSIDEDNRDTRRYTSKDGVLFYFNDNTHETEIKYYPPAKTGDYILPKTVTTWEVQFDGTTKKLVEVERVVTNIPVGVFINATNLTGITIPSSIMRVAETAFLGCTFLVKVEFLAALATETVELTIGANAFQECTRLTHIILPSHLKDFVPTILSSASALNKVDVAGTGGNYSSEDGMLTNPAKTILIYCPRGRSGTLTIPNGINIIADNAFSNSAPEWLGARSTRYFGTKISTLIIPGWVTNIGINAFRFESGTSPLTTLTFSTTASTPSLRIQRGAFYGQNNITTLTLPPNLTNLEVNAFGATNKLTNVTVLSEGDINFAVEAFGIEIVSSWTTSAYYVTDLHLGEKVGMIALGDVFGNKLQRVTVDSANNTYIADKGVVFNKKMTQLLFYPSAKTDLSYSLPTSVTEIGSYAFSDAENLEIVVLNAGLTKIGIGAFRNARVLQTVKFAATGTSLIIEELAFSGTASLTSIELPNYLTRIGLRAFYSSGLTSIVIPSSVVEIGGYAFANCANLLTVNILEGLTELGNFAFQNASRLQTINLPASLTVIAYNVDEGFNLFSGCAALKDIIVASANPNYKTIHGILYGLDGGIATDLLFSPRSNQGITVDEFEGVVIIPESVRNISAKAFLDNAGIKEIRFERTNLISWPIVIGTDAFKNCTGLVKFTFPSGTTQITNIFTGCTSLIEIVIPNTVASLQSGAFSGLSQLKNITFESGNLSTPLVIQDGTSPTNGVFYGLRSLEQIHFPERTTKIGDYAFTGSSGVINALTVVTIPSTVQTIGQFAFKDNGSVNYNSGVSGTGNRRLTTVNITDTKDNPSQLRAIYQFAFNNCSALYIINLPQSLEMIGGTATSTATNAGGVFNNTAISSVTIPKLITNIHTSTFQNSRNLTNVYFHNDSELLTIGNDAFRDCGALLSIDIPATVTTLGTAAFRNDKSMTAVNFKTFPTGHADAGKASLEVLGASGTNTGVFENTGLTQFSFPISRNTNSIAYFANTFLNARNLRTIHFSRSVAPQSGTVTIPDLLATTYVTSITVEDDYDLLKIQAGIPILFNSIGEWVIVFSTLNGNTAEEGTYALPGNTTQIATRAFANQTRIKKLIIPRTVNTIGNFAFANMVNLDEIVFLTDTADTDPTNNTGFSNLSTIGTNLFENCVKLKKVNFSRTRIQTLSAFTFNNCVELDEVKLPNHATGNTLTTIDGYAFRNTPKLNGRLTIPARLTTFNENALRAASFKELVFEAEQLTVRFYNRAFADNKNLEIVVFPLKTTVNNLFGNNINAANTNNPGAMFENCTSLKIITNKVLNPDLVNPNLSESERNIVADKNTLPALDTGVTGGGIAGSSVFAGCTSLTNIAIVGITQLSVDMFNGCTSLASVTLAPNTTHLGVNTFKGSALTSFTIPATVNHLGSVNDSVVGVGTNVGIFENCEKLQSVTFASNTAPITMGANVFQNTPLLTTITVTGYQGTGNVLPESLRLIGNNAFRKSGIQNITIRETSGRTASVGFTFGTYVFAESALTSVNIQTVARSTSATANSAFSANMFQDCKALASVTLNDDINVFSADMFNGCTALKGLTLPTSLVALGARSFQNSGLKSIELPQKMVQIRPGTGDVGIATTNCEIFDGCRDLEKVVVSSALTRIAPNTFRNTGLKRIYYKGYEGADKTDGYDENDNYENKINVLPSTLTLIGNGAFQNTKLPNITFNSALTSANMGTYIFSGSALLSAVVLHDNQNIIQTGMFKDCTALQTITLPANLATINADAFSGSGLVSLLIPEKVEVIGNNAFGGCMQLVNLQVDMYNIIFKINDYGLLIHISTDALVYVPVSETGTVNLTGIRSIRDYAFVSRPDITEVILSDSLESIGAYAFWGSGITSIVIPSSVSSIGNYAFAYSDLESVVINGPANDEEAFLTGYTLSLGTHVFLNNAQLSSITLNDYITAIGANTFEGCILLTSVTMPKKITAISANLFLDSGLVSIVLSTNTATIGASAFQNTTSLKNITYTGFTGVGNALPSTITKVNVNAFRNTGLEQIHIPVVTIAIGTSGDRYIFADSLLLSEVTFEEGQLVLGEYMFNGCISLENITLPQSLVFMAIYTFQDSGLHSIAIPESVIHLGTSSGSAASATSAVYLFDGCLSLETVILSSGLATMGAGVFRNTPMLTSITYIGYEGTKNAFPESLYLIGDYAFFGTGLTEITIIESIITVGTHMFAESALITLVIETRSMANGSGNFNTVTHLFANCKSLTTVKLPEGAVINEYGFEGCTSISSIVLPKGVQVRQGAFSGWTADQTINVIDSRFLTLRSWAIYTGEGISTATNSSAYGTNTWDFNCKANIVFDYNPAP